MKSLVFACVLFFPCLAWGQLTAPPTDPRFDNIEKRLYRIETKLGILDCPCPEGTCVCTNDNCLCPNCPIHRKSVQGKTEEKTAKNYTGKGREVLFFTADWCPNCPREKNELGDLYSKVIPVDVDNSKLDERFGVASLPTSMLVVDGRVESRAVGEHAGSRLIVGDWINGNSAPSGGQQGRGGSSRSTGRSVVRYSRSTWTYPGNLAQHLATTHGINTSGLSFSQLRTIHDNLHNTGRSGITSGSVDRQPVQPYFRYNSCPSCVR